MRVGKLRKLLLSLQPSPLRISHTLLFRSRSLLPLSSSGRDVLSPLSRSGVTRSSLGTKTRGRLSKALKCVMITAAFCPLLSPEVSAQRLSIRHYDIRDGLAHNRAHS